MSTGGADRIPTRTAVHGHSTFPKADINVASQLSCSIGIWQHKDDSFDRDFELTVQALVFPPAAARFEPSDVL